jgi:anaerobic selenocysteine-containing dehydrogenase
MSPQNNPYLSELVPENVLWINTEEGKTGITNGQVVKVHRIMASEDQSL